MRSPDLYIGGLLTLLGALICAELASALPRAGGFGRSSGGSLRLAIT